MARRNATRHGVGDRMTFIETSFLDGIETGVDVIVSNPPYVPSVSEPGLTPEVRDYEPRCRGVRRCRRSRRIAQRAGRSGGDLAPGGWLVMEFGCGQDDCVTALVTRVNGLES